LDRFDGTGLATTMFAHVLRKSAFREFRLYINNIVLLSPDYKGYSIHHLFDNGSVDQIIKFEDETNKSFKILFQLEESLYNEYVLEFGSGVIKRKIIELYKNYRK
jgi:hypothetical protein